MCALLALPAEILDQIFTHLVPPERYQRSEFLERRSYGDLRTLCMVCTGPAERVAERLYWEKFFLGTSQLRDGYSAELPLLKALSRNPALAANIRQFGHGRHNTPLEQTLEAFQLDTVQKFIDDTYAEPFCIFIRNMFANARERGKEVEEHGMYLAVVLILTLAVNVETVTTELVDRRPTAITKLFAFSGARILEKGRIQQAESRRRVESYRIQQGKLQSPLWHLKSIMIPSPGDHYSYWTDFVSSSYISPLLGFPWLHSFSTRCIKWDRMVDRSKQWEDSEWVVPMPWNDEKYGDISARGRFFLQTHATWPAMRHLRLEHAESRDVNWSRRSMWPERKWLQLEHGIEDDERVGTRPRTLRLDSILPRFPNLESLAVVPKYRRYGPYEWRSYGDDLMRHGANLKSLELRLDDLNSELYSIGTIGPLTDNLTHLTHLNSSLMRLVGDQVHGEGEIDVASVLPPSLTYLYTATTARGREMQALGRMFETSCEKLPNLRWVLVDAFYNAGIISLFQSLPVASWGFGMKKIGVSSFLFWKTGSQPQSISDISSDWYRCWIDRDARQRHHAGI